MKHWNKFLALALCCAMVLSCMPVAWADGVTTPTDVCEHKNTREQLVSEEMLGYEPIEGDNTYHTVNYKVKKNIVCNNCGVCVDQISETEARQLKHSILIGANNATNECFDCGMVSTCQHANAVIKDTYENPTYKPKDKNNHDLYGYNAERQFNCPDCNLSGGYGFEGYGYIETLPHEFDENDVCTLCGYDPSTACKHEMLGMNQHWENAVYTEIEGDNANHAVKGDWVQVTFCDNCSELLERKVLETKEGKEQHSYDEDDVCWTCGHKNTCKHEDTLDETSRLWGSFAYTEIEGDDLYHIQSYRTITYTLCQGCNKLLKYTEGTETIEEKEKHIYQDGVCSYCGHKNVCAHKSAHAEQYIGGGEAVYEQYDSEYHRFVGNLYEYMCCDDCGMQLSETKVVQENASELIRHANWSNNNAKCASCGYEFNCEHERFEIVDCWDSPSSMKYTEVDDKEHIAMGDWITSKQCVKCKMKVATYFIDTNHTETEAHDMKDGVCTKCGYKAPEPTAAPTAEPEAPTVEPEQPTAAPEAPEAPEAPAAPAVTEEPAAEPTAAPEAPEAPAAPAVTEEPAAEPTAALMQDLVEEVVEQLAAAAEEGKEVTVEIIGTDEVLNEEEYQQLVALPVQEQLVVTLASIGYADVVKAAVEALNITLSDEAAALMDTVTARMDTMTDEEKQAMDAKLAELFPEVEVEIDGKTYTFHVIELKIVVDGEETLQKYGFRLDENNVWVFVKL